MFWKSSVAVAVLLIAGAVTARFTIAQDAQPQAAPATAAIGAPAPAFSLQDQDGTTVNLADYSGKLVVLEWFNEECPIVQGHYKDDAMNNLAGKYMEKGVVWLAVNSTSGKTNADNKKAAEAWNMGRPILNDASGKVGHLYGATNTPNMYVIDTKGNLAYMGAIDNNASGDQSPVKNYVSQALDQLMAGTTVSEPKTKAYGCTVKYAS